MTAHPDTARTGPAPRTATPRTARLINDRLAFGLLCEHGPLTRSQLHALTGLSRPTVAELLDRLAGDGLIAVVGESGAARRGPNAALYGVVADRAHVAGVEVRPDAVIAVRADVTGAVVDRVELPLDPAAPPHTQVLAALGAAGVDERLGAVVIGTPGLIDPTSGDVAYIAGLPGWHHNLLAGLRERIAAPVRLDNEVNLVGLAEHRLGAARGHDTYALLSLGRGLGVAVLLDGRLHRGASGGAGEVGYLPLAAEPTGRTLGDLLSGSAVGELARRYGARDTEVAAAVARVADDDGFLAELADRVAVGAAGVCAVLDPGFVLLAGPIGLAGGDRLAERVAARLAELTPFGTQVRAGTVVDDPVVTGAVGVALDLLHRTTFDAPSLA